MLDYFIPERKFFSHYSSANNFIFFEIYEEKLEDLDDFLKYLDSKTAVIDIDIFGEIENPIKNVRIMVEDNNCVNIDYISNNFLFNNKFLYQAVSFNN